MQFVKWSLESDSVSKSNLVVNFYITHLFKLYNGLELPELYSCSTSFPNLTQLQVRWSRTPQRNGQLIRNAVIYCREWCVNLYRIFHRSNLILYVVNFFLNVTALCFSVLLRFIWDQ